MADATNLSDSALVSGAWTATNNADNGIDAVMNQLADGVSSETGAVGKVYIPTFGDIDPQKGSGTLIIDRYMSELSNLESVAANAVATSQRIQKEVNSKLS